MRCRILILAAAGLGWVFGSAVAASDATSRGMVLGPFPTAYLPSKGVLQVSPYVNYIQLNMAEKLGLDIDPVQSRGVRKYFEKGMRTQFGLAPGLGLSYDFSLTDFSYATKEAEVSSQDVRLKKGFARSPRFGTFAAELGWRRHSTNELKNSGVALPLSNVLHDYGYGLRGLWSRPLRDYDLHASFGLSDTPEDGDGGQHGTDLSAGFSRFWAGRWQADAFYQLFDVHRKHPLYSRSSKDRNQTFSFGVMRHLTDRWALELRARANDNLFRGIWPFLDREVDRLNFSTYGYFTFALTYRHDYGR